MPTRTQLREQAIRTVGHDRDKMTRYGELVKALMEDQINRINDHSHERRITEQNSRESLRMAVQANTLARNDLPASRAELANT